MALECLIWTRGGAAKRVVNIAVRGSNVAGDDYDPAHQQVIDIIDQRHDGDRRMLETDTGLLRLLTSAELADEINQEAIDSSLVNGPVPRP